MRIIRECLVGPATVVVLLWTLAEVIGEALSRLAGGDA